MQWKSVHSRRLRPGEARFHVRPPGRGFMQVSLNKS